MQDKKKHKKSKDKLILDKYIQEIYPPYNLYVMAHHTSDDITNKFVWDDGDVIDKVELDDYQGLTYGLVYNKDDKDKLLSVLVCLNVDRFDDDIDAMNTIAHEAFHVVFRIFKHCNVHLSEGTNEPYAFMTGWAAKNIYQTYKKAKK
jgi:hypothetical protein